MASSLLGHLVSKVKAWQTEHLPGVPLSLLGSNNNNNNNNNNRQRVPPQLDVHYITDTLLAASQPLAAPAPTFTDTGRDVWRDREGNKPSTTTRISISKSEPVQAAEERGEGDTVEQEPHRPQQEQQQQQQQHREAAPSPTPDRTSRTTLSLSLSLSSSQDPRTATSGGTPQQQQRPPTQPQPRTGNSPATLVNFLDQRHGRGNYLVVSLADAVPDDRTLLLLQRNIVQLPWQSAGRPASETPTLVTMLAVCYALQAWLHQDDVDPSNNNNSSNNNNNNNNSSDTRKKVALLYCANGKTRTAIAVACYLKFVGQVHKTRDGFGHFLERRCPDHAVAPHDVIRQLPASLHAFFDNFDNCMELGHYMNNKPLLLTAIALQGIPVEDKPCLDIWDAAGRHVYSSHADLWDDLVETNPWAAPNDAVSQWADEEGFYRVNVILQGDFCLLCRFGGAHAQDAGDATKIMFRYANTTAFLAAGGPYELPPAKVDLMRRYAHCFDPDDFLLSLLFKSHWCCEDPNVAALLKQECSEDVLPPILEGFEAMEQGWHVITKYHSARPASVDVDRFVQQYATELTDCPRHLASLSLRLTNFDWKAAHELLLKGSIRSWWLPDPDLSDEEWSESSVFDTSMLGPLYTSAIMTPHAFDVAGAFVPHGSFSHTQIPRQKLEVGVKPLFPMVRDKFSDMAPGEELELANRMPIEDPDNAGAVELLHRINHTGVTLDDLIDLRRASRHWNTNTMPSRSPQLSSDTGVPMSTVEIVHGLDRVVRSQSHVQASTGTPTRVDEHAANAAQNQVGRVDTQWSRDETKQDGPTQMTSQLTVTQPTASQPTTSSTGGKAGNAAPHTAGDNSTILPAAEEKVHESEKSETNKEGSGAGDNSSGDPPLREDPEYVKYYKMLKMGLPRGAVQNAMQKDGKDPSIMDLDPDKSLKSQPCNSLADEGPPLKEDPEYVKYFKMLKMGLPKGAVQNALQKDGKDPSIMDLDPDKNLKSQTRNLKVDDGSLQDNGPPLKDDPEYVKYFKMLKMGLPKGAVQNALEKDGKDPSIMDLDLDKSLKSQTSDSAADNGPPLKDDPEYVKYFKMLKMGLPKGAVQNALEKDGKDPSIMDLDPDKSLKSQISDSEADDGPPLKDDPEYEKYFKMQKMGLPKGAVQNALQKDGKDPSIMDLDPDKSLKSQMGCGESKADDGPPLKDDPEYAKYFQMQKMGLPVGAIKNALERDSKDASVMDLDPSKSLASQTKPSHRRRRSTVKKPRVRRKKIYWNPIDPGQIKEDSLWSLVKDRVKMSRLNYDVKEFEDLFTESADPSQKRKTKKGSASKAKKSLQVIDGKRSMNGGIILLRLKIDHAKIAKMVNNMDHGKLDATQIKALREFLPTFDERNGLVSYLKGTESSKEAKEAAVAALSETEKYMITMLDVADADAKFNCMLYRSQFRNRSEDLIQGIKVVEKACEEVKGSERLREIMAMILTLVNQINTGGEGGGAAGFNLEALLKLNEAKAFDKKTSVLHYLVKLLKQNDELLVGFHNDLQHIADAENTILDSLVTEIRVLKDELVQVHATAKLEADRLEEVGQLTQISLKDLMEQRTAVRNIESIPQFNKMDHLTGRTPMERFALGAGITIDQAIEHVDSVKDMYGKLLEYFGEDGKMPSNEFFGTMRRFVTEFGTAVEQVEKAEKAKLKEERRLAAKANSPGRKTKSSPPARKDGGGKPSPSGTAAIAAAGATRKNDSKEIHSGLDASKETVGPPTMAGIAAMAAAAAAKKIKPPTHKDGETKTEGVAGIAVMAAAASRNKSPEKFDKPSTERERRESMSGIAAMAAAAGAARKSRSSKQEVVLGDEAETLVSMPDIATMAAAAAARKNRALKQADDPSTEAERRMLTSGIATMAAAAAAARKTKLSQHEESDAMAAAAIMAGIWSPESQSNNPPASIDAPTKDVSLETPISSIGGAIGEPVDVPPPFVATSTAELLPSTQEEYIDALDPSVSVKGETTVLPPQVQFAVDSSLIQEIDEVPMASQAFAASDSSDGANNTLRSKEENSTLGPHLIEESTETQEASGVSDPPKPIDDENRTLPSNDKVPSESIHPPEAADSSAAIGGEILALSCREGSTSVARLTGKSVATPLENPSTYIEIETPALLLLDEEVVVNTNLGEDALETQPTLQHPGSSATSTEDDILADDFAIDTSLTGETPKEGDPSDTVDPSTSTDGESSAMPSQDMFATDLCLIGEQGSDIADLPESVASSTSSESETLQDELAVADTGLGEEASIKPPPSPASDSHSSMEGQAATLIRKEGFAANSSLGDEHFEATDRPTAADLTVSIDIETPALPLQVESTLGSGRMGEPTDAQDNLEASGPSTSVESDTSELQLQADSATMALSPGKGTIEALAHNPVPPTDGDIRTQKEGMDVDATDPLEVSDSFAEVEALLLPLQDEVYTVDPSVGEETIETQQPLQVPDLTSSMEGESATHNGDSPTNVALMGETSAAAMDTLEASDIFGSIESEASTLPLQDESATTDTTPGGEKIDTQPALQAPGLLATATEEAITALPSLDEFAIDIRLTGDPQETLDPSVSTDRDNTASLSQKEPTTDAGLVEDTSEAQDPFED